MPHVRRYYVGERQAVLDAICAGNPVALKNIRDATGGNQMAKVAAIRTLEQLEERMDERAGGPDRAPAPGIVIVTIGPARPPATEGTAEEFGDADPCPGLPPE